MAHPKQYITTDDLRGQLRAWLKENCLKGFKKAEVIRYRLEEFLSMKLVDRNEYGFKKSLTKLEIIHEIKKCGSRGEWQKHKETNEERGIGHYCNNRKYHLPCAERHRRGQGIEIKNQYMEISKANDLWGFYHWTFTIPEMARAWIDNHNEQSKSFLLDVRRAVASTIKETFGVNKKARGVQPGFSILYHAASSGNPFRQSSHFHALALPMLVDLKHQTIKKFEKMVPHGAVKRAFKKHLDKVFKKYGLAEFIEDDYNIHLHYVDKEMESSVNHLFLYNNRSQVADILKTIKKANSEFNQFVCLLFNKQYQVFIPSLKSLEEILEALEFVLNPLIQVRMSYGFMRVLKKYSILLGIKRDDYEEDENWETLFKIRILRIYKNIYDKEAGKVRPQITLLIFKEDSYQVWRKLKPDEFRGELSSMSNRKLFKSIR